MTIPLADLKAQYDSIKPEIDAAISRVLDSSAFILGEEVAAFEREFAAYTGTAHAIAVNSGASALHLALLAAGVGPGAEVITVPFTFVATAAAVLYTGGRPVYVDVDARHYTMDPAQIERAITPRTRAILPVHLYGQAADMRPILEIARRCNLAVVEDAAQAHGAAYEGRRLGSIGDLGCFSFYPGKNLGAYGDAGAVVTNDPAWARLMRMLRDWGQNRKSEHLLKGFNYRMAGIQGAILRVKLRHLERWTEARRSNALLYDRLLAGAEDIVTPAARADARHVYHAYTIRSTQREVLRQRLAECGIQTGIHYPTPVHLQPAYADPAWGPGSFPVAETAARQVLSLPIYAELTHSQVEEVAAAVRQPIDVSAI